MRKAGAWKAPWRCVAELAALRRDAAVFARPLYLRTVTDPVEREYLERFFDQVHRQDATVYHMRNGVAHRVDGPAVEYENGDKEWFLYGERHCTDAPAIESLHERFEAWYCHGERHRVGGPAVTSLKGTEWWFRGKLHRTDGPAIEDYHARHWYVDGVLHRVGGPAYEELNVNGVRKWYFRGKLHRVGGPAVVQCYDSNEWFVHGKRHRMGAPAVEKKDNGRSEYWIDGVWLRGF